MIFYCCVCGGTFWRERGQYVAKGVQIMTDFHWEACPPRCLEGHFQNVSKGWIDRNTILLADLLWQSHLDEHQFYSPEDSGTKNGGTEPYKVWLFWGWGFPLDFKPYPYSLHRWAPPVQLYCGKPLTSHERLPGSVCFLLAFTSTVPFGRPASVDIFVGGIFKDKKSKMFEVLCSWFCWGWWNSYYFTKILQRLTNCGAVLA